MESTATEPPQVDVSDGRNGESAATIHVMRACTIRKEASDLYAFWLNYENLPPLAKVPLKVFSTGTNTTHWTATAPDGKQRLEWDVVIVKDTPSEMLVWQSPRGLHLCTRVRFSLSQPPAMRELN